MSSGFPVLTEAAHVWARRWLTLAVSAVAISGVFAILIALARVPAVGMLFPGAEFYRVALVLHVNLSQGVWFMAFSCVLWSVYSACKHEAIERMALFMAAVGTAGLVLSVSAGDVRPLMSNYLPVLDGKLFLSALVLFGIGVLFKALTALPVLDWRVLCGRGGVMQRALLNLSVVASLLVFVLLVFTLFSMPAEVGMPFFETLFWGAGHLWQFALLTLLMFSWLHLVDRREGLPASMVRLAVAMTLIPVVLSLTIPFVYPPGSAGSNYLYTWLMVWTSWEAPLLLGCLILLRIPRLLWAPGFALSLLLFVAGLLIGSQIDGQTTLVTAHYHGTIGAVTLAFMALSFRLLPVLGLASVSTKHVRWQLGFYGYGILLMMAGLAGAGLMGAPRKTPGDLALTFGVETFSRICLGIGGLCATIGILMFACLLLRRLCSPARVEAYSL